MRCVRQMLLSLLPLMVAAGTPEAVAEPVNPTTVQERGAPWLRVFGVTQPDECRDGPTEDMRRLGTAAEIAELDGINRRFNREIEPVSDLDLYGVTEYWTLPRHKKGDCEDYALVKRHILMQAGWPASALLLTVVLDEKNEGHAVLTARTAAGDYVLDNKTDELKLWHKTPYKFVMRQSYLNPRLWMSLDPKEAMPSVPMAGMRVAKAPR
jgi:predicted transglutaminase-like cysteine proteinase